MKNLDTANYERMSDREAGFNTIGRNASCGVMVHKVSICEVIANKNGVELRQITVKEKTHFELYMDGELLNKFSNIKTAKAMWKDFSC